jgi:hypothetical protein
MIGNNLGVGRVGGSVRWWSLLAMVAGLTVGTGLTGAFEAAEVKLDGRTFRVPEGFTIEQIAGTPLVDRPIMRLPTWGGGGTCDSSNQTPVVSQLTEKLSIGRKRSMRFARRQADPFADR